jgi:hypothetical protein
MNVLTTLRLGTLQESQLAGVRAKEVNLATMEGVLQRLVAVLALRFELGDWPVLRHCRRLA